MLSFDFKLARKETIIIARGDSLFCCIARQQLYFNYRSMVLIHESRTLYECILIVKIIPRYDFRSLHEFVLLYSYHNFI